jgi:hypothetical protein
LRRREFSNWIAGVFGDYPLAKTLRQIEDGYLAGGKLDAASSLAQAVRARYEPIDAGPVEWIKRRSGIPRGATRLEIEVERLD